MRTTVIPVGWAEKAAKNTLDTPSSGHKIARSEPDVEATLSKPRSVENSEMRKALIGISSPIGYNFSYPTDVERANPVLDAPWGVFVFYDEVWFLTRHLCPHNLQTHSCVKFVDQEYDLGKLDLPTYADYTRVRDAIPQPTRAEARTALETAIRANSRPGWRVDTNGPVFRVGAQTLHSTPHPASLLVDDHVASTLGLDLITNGQTSLYSKRCVASNLASQLTQYAIAESLPNFQTLEGPYHPVLDDLRSMRSIKAFRAKAEEWTAGKDTESLPRLKADLESDFRDFTARVIGEKVGRWNLFLATADLVIGNIPILSSVWGNLKGVHSLADAIQAGHTHGWAAFVANARKRKVSTEALRPFPTQSMFKGNTDHLAVLRNCVEHSDVWGWNEWNARKQPQGVPLNPDPDEELPDPGPVQLAAVNLSGIELYGIDFGSVDLKGANLSSAILNFANFGFADLEGADLRGATLQKASFSVANLTGADLRGIDLHDADLAGATLINAKLEGANLPPNFKMDEEGRVPYWTT